VNREPQHWREALAVSEACCAEYIRRKFLDGGTFHQESEPIPLTQPRSESRDEADIRIVPGSLMFDDQGRVTHLKLTDGTNTNTYHPLFRHRYTEWGEYLHCHTRIGRSGRKAFAELFPGTPLPPNPPPCEYVPAGQAGNCSG
jgi:hypothetical protein